MSRIVYMREVIRKDAEQRLKRMAGQVTGISKMLEEEQYCLDILTQVASLRGALEGFGSLIVAAHIEDCVVQSEGELKTSQTRFEEVRKTLMRFLK